MSGRVDDALGVLRAYVESHGDGDTALMGVVDVLAGELERLEAAWQEAEHPFDKSEYDAMYARTQVLTVQVEQLREALREIRMCSDDDRVVRLARAALEAGSTTPEPSP